MNFRFKDRFAFNQATGKIEVGLLIDVRFDATAWERMDLVLPHFERRPHIVTIGGEWLYPGGFSWQVLYAWVSPS